MEFKDRLNSLIEKIEVSAYRICKETAITQQSLSDYRKGISKPKQAKLDALAKFFDVSPIWLQTGYGDADPQYENPKTKKYLDIVSCSDQVYEAAHRILGIDEDEKTKEFLEYLTRELPEGNDEDTYVKPAPKKAEKPLSTEDRLMFVIESQQKIIESLQAMLAAKDKNEA